MLQGSRGLNSREVLLSSRMDAKGSGRREGKEGGREGGKEGGREGGREGGDGRKEPH